MLAATKRLFLPKPMSMPSILDCLRAEDVPFSSDPCRNCPDPCDEGHDFWRRLDIDQDSQLLGTVKPYGKQCVISTGLTDWPKEVTDVKGSLAAELSTVHEHRRPSFLKALSESKQNGARRRNQPIPGVFNSEDSNRLSILNGSHNSVDPDSDVESVLVFPDFKIVNVPATSAGANSLWEEHIHGTPSTSIHQDGIALDTPPSHEPLPCWILPYACVILLCSHKKRDNRCSITAMKLEKALQAALEYEGWEVHTELEHVGLLGPPMTPEEMTSEEHRDSVLASSQKRALILKNSHIGGHKFAGNVMIYTPSQAGIWYGRVTTHNVEPIVRKTIIEGKVLPALLRGGVNITCRKNGSLMSW